jgi:hypothetical protein
MLIIKVYEVFDETIFIKSCATEWNEIFEGEEIALASFGTYKKN